MVRNRTLRYGSCRSGLGTAAGRCVVEELAIGRNYKVRRGFGKHHARAAAANASTRRTNSRGFGSLLRICHDTKLMTVPPRGGDPRTNLSSREENQSTGKPETQNGGILCEALSPCSLLGQSAARAEGCPLNHQISAINDSIP